MLLNEKLEVESKVSDKGNEFTDTIREYIDKYRKKISLEVNKGFKIRLSLNNRTYLIKKGLSDITVRELRSDDKYALELGTLYMVLRFIYTKLMDKDIKDVEEI